MAMVINTNISSLNAQRQLAGSANKLGTAMERLSSGLRINSAKDDAAGLAISSRMTTQITGLNVAQRNANDGISLAQTAEGALSTIGNNLQRIRELAVQSRNATNSTDDRAALQKEVDQLKSEIDRVAKNTSFNGTNLLDGSFTSKSFQVGANQGERIDVDSIQNAQIASLGSWKSNDVQATVTSSSAVQAGTVVPSVSTQDGAFAQETADATVQTLEINGVSIASNTISTGATPVAGLTAEQIDQALADKADDLKAKNVVVSGKAADGNLSIKTTDGSELTVTNTGTGLDLNATTAGTTAYPAVTFTINGEDITTDAKTSLEDFGAEVLSKIEANTNLSGKVTASFAGGKLTLTGINQDLELGGADIAKLGLEAGTTSYKAGKAETGFKDLSIKTAEDADNAILAMDAALKSVNSARADLGAIQNRFESVVSNLASTSENLTASRSRILDADFAVETANLSSAQVLQQAGTAMVAQANQLPQNVLSLLR